MNRRLHCLLAIPLISCGQDSSFTKLLEPEPSAEDTSAPPVEAIEDVVPEDPDTCPDNLYSAQLATVDEACKIEPPTWRYTPVIEWKMDRFDEESDAVWSMFTPMVGHLTDDDDDVLVHEDVFRLQISVHDSIRMHVSQSHPQLNGYIEAHF